MLGQIYPRTKKKKKEVGALLHDIYEMNSKWIIGLCVRDKTINVLEENTGLNICDLGLDNGLLNLTSKVQAATTTKLTNWISSKLKSFYFKDHQIMKE